MEVILKRKLLGILLTLAIVLTLGVLPMGVAGAADPVNLIVNGDFEEAVSAAEPTMYNSDYLWLNPANTGGWTLGPPFMYTIGTSPSLYHSAWGNFGDHTTGTGQMMIVNGTEGQTNNVIWGQDVTGLTTPSSAVTTYKLFAGQTWEVGSVLVKTDTAGKVCVKFILNASAIADNWVITEAHVAVAATCAGIPQTQPNKKGLGGGNPIPGQFPINVTIDPGVTETDWYCLDYNWTARTPLCVAAHSVVKQIVQRAATINVDLVSGAGTDNVILLAEDPLNLSYPVGYTAPFQNYSGTSTPSVLAWTHSAWAPYGVAGAEWISSAQYAETPDVNTWRLFTRSFSLPADAFNISGVMTANADNSEDIYLNGVFIGDGAPAIVYGASPPSGPAHGWSSVESWSANPQAGTNNLWIMTRNYGWPGGAEANPTALTYKLSYQYSIPTVYGASQTAWGDGTPFPGANWATCISYTPSPIDYGSYTLTFWGGSSYVENPAQIQVKINGDVVGSTLLLSSTVPGWLQYTATWNAGAVNHANIELFDLRNVYSGDDFVLDDISFVKN